VLTFVASQPNIDFFSREELKQVIRKFKEDCENGNIDLDQVSNAQSFIFYSHEEALSHLETVQLTCLMWRWEERALIR
jgi:hypothetical protein